MVLCPRAARAGWAGSRDLSVHLRPDLHVKRYYLHMYVRRFDGSAHVRRSACITIAMQAKAFLDSCVLGILVNASDMAG